MVGFVAKVNRAANYGERVRVNKKYDMGVRKDGSPKSPSQPFAKLHTEESSVQQETY